MANSSIPSSLSRENAPSSIRLPVIPPLLTQNLMNGDDTLITSRAADSNIHPLVTPGLAMGAATPHLNGINRPSTGDEGTTLEKRTSQQSQPRNSTDRTSDYFSSGAQAKSPVDGQFKGPATPGDGSLEAATWSPVDTDKEEKSGSLFSKKFRMNFPKKLGRTSVDVRPAVVDEISEESDKSEEKEDKSIQDNLFGTIQKIRYDYEERFRNDPSRHLSSGIVPSPLNETPLLQLPPSTAVIIQEDRPDSGGVADIYRGTISSVGNDADLIEKAGPMWLGDLLFKVRAVSSGYNSLGMLTKAEPHARERCRQGLVRAVTIPRPFT